MIAQLKRGYHLLATRPKFRVALQATVSLILIVLLIILAQRSRMLDSLGAISLDAIVNGVALLSVAYMLNSGRWLLLLRNAGVRERLSNLVGLYFIGQFFSLFLPTGAGGDAVRMYDVARRSKMPAQTIMATLQERLFGLAASLLIGLVATLYYLPLVPAQLRIWAVAIQIVGGIGVSLLVYPSLFFGVIRRIWQTHGHRPSLQRIAARPLVVRGIAALGPIAELPPLKPIRFLLLLGLAGLGVLLGIATYYVLGRSLQIEADFLVFCTVVPLVWISRMAPISLNGLGVGEGAFVFLMSLFGAPSGKSLALALAFFALQTGLALFGGLLLAWRMLRGTWSPPRPIAAPAEGEAT